MLPPSPKDFRDIYVVFELLETDLHQVRWGMLCALHVWVGQRLHAAVAQLLHRGLAFFLS